MDVFISRFECFFEEFGVGVCVGRVFGWVGFRYGGTRGIFVFFVEDFGEFIGMFEVEEFGYGEDEVRVDEECF